MADRAAVTRLSKLAQRGDSDYGCDLALAPARAHRARLGAALRERVRAGPGPGRAGSDPRPAHGRRGRAAPGWGRGVAQAPRPVPGDLPRDEKGATHTSGGRGWGGWLCR